MTAAMHQMHYSLKSPQNKRHQLKETSIGRYTQIWPPRRRTAGFIFYLEVNRLMNATDWPEISLTWCSRFKSDLIRGAE